MSDNYDDRDISAEAGIRSFGCRLNLYESEVMRQHVQQAGLKDALIFNTCAVTQEAERQARQAIRKARREHPDKRIIVTGCAAQINPQRFAAMAEVDHVLGNAEKMEATSWQRLATGDDVPVRVQDIMQLTETAPQLIHGFTGHSRAFLQVQNGCDHRCTFCIIPYGRGNSRSVPIGEIARQMRLLVAEGYREIVLTGVDVTSYGPDLPGTPTLGQMIRRVLAQVPELPRLRLSSLDPVEIDDDLWRLIAEEERLMPHLHLSLQAGDDMTLKRMKRRHLRQDVLDMVARCRDLRPDIVFGADIIAGFPTETEEMFAQTLNIVTESDLTWLHVFPYSPREGTPAARMPQVERATIKRRATQLREAGEAQVIRYLDHQIGQQHEVLMEAKGIARTRHFAEVILTEGETAQEGEILPVEILARQGQQLLARRIARSQAA